VGQVILYIVLAGAGAISFFRPWVGVVFCYLVVLLTPHNIWWWNFQGVRANYWIMGPTLVGLFVKVLCGEYDISAIKSKRNGYILILWVCFAFSYYFGPYVRVPSHYRFYDASFVFSVINNIFLLYFVACLCINDGKRLKALVLGCVIAVGYLIYWANDQYLSGVQFGRIHGPIGLSGRGIYFDENAFGMLFVVGLPFLYYFGRSLEKKILRWALWLAVPFGWHAVFLTGSRGSLVGLIVTIVVAAFRSRVKKTGVFVIGAFMIAFAWQAGDLMKGRAESIADYKTDHSASTRLEAWEAAIHMIIRHPLTGVGLGSFGPAFPDNSESVPREAHNTFFQIGAESGVLGGVMYMLLVSGCLTGLWRNGRRFSGTPKGEEERFLYFMNEAALVSLCGFVTCALFLSLHIYEMFYYLCVIVNGVLFLSKHCSAFEEERGSYENGFVKAANI
jgi:putative inorganic carbon (hco3(-)) transporter